MATFKVNFVLGNSFEGSITLVGAKVPKATMKKWYGSVDDKEIYRCHKNEYGIVYLIKEYSSRFDTYYWSISDDPSKTVKRLPRYTRLNVIER